MAFQLNGLDPSNSGSGGAALLGTYRTADAKAVVLASGYFNEAAGNLRWTKAVLVSASDGMFIASIESDGSEVVAAEYAPGSGAAVTWDDIEDKPATFPPVIGGGEDEAMAGNRIPSTEGITVGWSLKVAADDMLAWGADVNTTYTVGAAAEMTTGTATTGRLINATTFPEVLGAALARNSAIAALTETSTLEDVIAALKAG